MILSTIVNTTLRRLKNINVEGLFSDLKSKRWWLHKLSSNITTAMVDIKLASLTPKIGTHIFSLKMNKIIEKINDVTICNKYIEDMYDFFFSICFLD
jgi:hypothetical protein